MSRADRRARAVPRRSPSMPPRVNRCRSRSITGARQVAPSCRSSTTSEEALTRTCRSCPMNEARSAVRSLPAGRASSERKPGQGEGPAGAGFGGAPVSSVSVRLPRSRLTVPSAARSRRSRAPSTSTARGRRRPSSSSPIDSDTSARGTSAIRTPAASVAVIEASRTSSGMSTPRRNPSQARAAEPMCSRVGPLAGLAACSNRRASQVTSIGPCASRHARNPPPTPASRTSSSARVRMACSSRPVMAGRLTRQTPHGQPARRMATNRSRCRPPGRCPSTRKRRRASSASSPPSAAPRHRLAARPDVTAMLRALGGNSPYLDGARLARAARAAGFRAARAGAGGARGDRRGRPRCRRPRRARASPPRCARPSGSWRWPPRSPTSAASGRSIRSPRRCPTWPRPPRGRRRAPAARGARRAGAAPARPRRPRAGKRLRRARHGQARRARAELLVAIST